MSCKNCGNAEKIQVLQESPNDWLSKSEVAAICPECAASMEKFGITRVKKQYLIEKFNGVKMTVYELLYTGPNNTIMNLGNVSLNPNEPQYLTENELPFSYKTLRKMDNLTINKFEREGKPDSEEVKKLVNKALGKVGVVWFGASPKKVNDFGVFVRNVPRYDLTEDQVKKLTQSGSFKVVD